MKSHTDLELCARPSNAAGLQGQPCEDPFPPAWPDASLRQKVAQLLIFLPAELNNEVFFFSRMFFTSLI